MTQTRQPRTGGESAVVRAPQDGREVGVYPLAGPEEGGRYASEQMTELRVLMLKLD